MMAMMGSPAAPGGVSLMEVEAKLPPGFRFHPGDDELVCDYLLHRAAREANSAAAGGRMVVSGGVGPPPMVDVDLNKCEPWDLPEVACVGGKEWYFFSLRDRKYATGQRTNRATVSGYWKATGKDRSVTRRGALVGMRKTLVFYKGRAPKGKKTEWVMHEYRLDGCNAPPQSLSKQEDWVLCRVMCKQRTPLAPAKAARASSSSSSAAGLPPLMDSNAAFAGALEQVPCFSSFPGGPPFQCPGFPMAQQFSSGMSYMTGDSEVIRSVLSNISRGDQLMPSLPVGCMSDISLSSLGGPF